MRSNANDAEFSRRRFLAGAGAAAAAISLVPRHVLGGAGHLPPSGKVNLAFIGVGSQGLRVMLDFLRHDDVQIVAVCDPNRQSSDYPQWGHSEFCNDVRKSLGTDSGWEWLSPNRPIPLTHSMTAWGGTAGREPCRQIVDAYYALRKASAGYRACTAYADFRELLDKEQDVDAVVVCAADHLHAPVSVAAMRKGKHVFCQKPLTRTIHEARRMADVARETDVATQIAVGNQASEDTRRLCEWIAAGAIGPVRQVVNWSTRPFWPQALDRPKETPPAPEGLDWDLWLGPAPQRPFHPAYLPFVWRGWHDFGGGALGDMGCYSFDTIFRALKLEAPISVEASCTERYAETYPQASIIHFHFPARGDMPPLRLTWYDGRLRPPRPDELEDDRQLPDEGLMFVGDGGTVLCGFTGTDPRLIPEAKMRQFEQPPRTLPRSIGHEREWIEACKGSKDRPGGNFEFSGMVTETLLLGNVALRVDERVVWDRANLKALSPAAQQFVHPDSREGWTL